MMQKLLSSTVLESVPLKPLTTFKIGGAARFFSLAETEGELSNMIEWANEQQLPYLLLGRGSNILVADEGFPGLIITLGKDFTNINLNNDSVIAGAAALLSRLGMKLAYKGWSGFEFMCGIPGTVGGAVVMNAGTKSGEIKDTLSSVRVMSKDGSVRDICAKDLNLGYRHSCFKHSKDIVLSATFALKDKNDPKHTRQQIKRSLANRKAKQPRNPKNCGSIFKSPPGHQAWELVDRAGFRGATVGGALVAQEHSNWIVNSGTASASDVKRLIDNIQSEVASKFGIHLEREVLFVPEDIL